MIIVPMMRKHPFGWVGFRVSLLSAILLVAPLCHAKLAAAQGADPFPVYATDACASNFWLVPFEQGKADLSDFAQKRLDGLVDAWHVDGGPLLTSGRVDGTEESQYPGLSRRRLQTVLEALSKRGIPSEAVWARDDGGGHGFSENRPGISEPQNRIVLATLARGGEQCARNMVKARVDWLRRNCSFLHPKADKAACDEAMSRFD